MGYYEVILGWVEPWRGPAVMGVKRITCPVMRGTEENARRVWAELMAIPEHERSFSSIELNFQGGPTRQIEKWEYHV